MNHEKHEKSPRREGEGATRRKRLHKRRLVIGLPVLVVASGVLAALLMFFASLGDEFVALDLYYFGTNWGREQIRFTVEGQTEEALVAYVLTRLARLPEQFPGVRTFPRGVILTEALENREIVIEFYEDFGLSPSAKAIAIASITYTLTQLDFVNAVRITSGEVSSGPFGRENLLLDDNHLPERGGTRTFTMFFVHSTLPELFTETREIALHTNKTVETLLIEELISPTNGYYARPFPAGVRLRNNAIREGRICYIDFSSDFLTQIDGEENILLVIHSIIYTITENTDAEQVRLLFAGDVSSVELEAIDLAMPLSRPSPAHPHIQDIAEEIGYTDTEIEP